MERISVSSSNICSIGYEASSLTLEVEFKSGSIYQYMGVPQNEYDSLMSAASIGRHLNSNIKGRYRYVEVR